MEYNRLEWLLQITSYTIHLESIIAISGILNIHFVLQWRILSYSVITSKIFQDWLEVYFSTRIPSLIYYYYTKLQNTRNNENTTSFVVTTTRGYYYSRYSLHITTPHTFLFLCVVISRKRRHYMKALKVTFPWGLGRHARERSTTYYIHMDAICVNGSMLVSLGESSFFKFTGLLPSKIHKWILGSVQKTFHYAHISVNHPCGFLASVHFSVFISMSCHINIRFGLCINSSIIFCNGLR